jgi:phenylpyruvate tautomerase PptA (4-oxalocrotonate tautomerase family)
MPLVEIDVLEGRSEPELIAVVMIENEHEDWSLGRGQASHVELPRSQWR